MTTLTPDELAELGRLAEAATLPGHEGLEPWCSILDDYDGEVEDRDFIAAFNPETAKTLLGMVAEKDAAYERLGQVFAAEHVLAGQHRDERDAALAERDALQRIIDGYDRTPAEERAAKAEVERDAAMGDVERLEGALASALAEVMTLHGKVAAVEAEIFAEPILNDWAKRYWHHKESSIPMLAVTIEDYRTRVTDRLRAALGTDR